MKHIKKLNTTSFLCIFLCSCKHIPELNEPIVANFQNEIIKKEKEIIKPLSNEWYKKTTIAIKEDMPIKSFIKILAKNAGLRILLDDSIAQEKINYHANNQTIIKIISDICQIYNWKLLINSVNANISKDSSYAQIHPVPYLAIERKSKSDTNISNKLKSDKKISDSSSSASLESSSSLNSFEELQKNLAILISSYEKEEKKYKFSINKQAGMLILFAPQKIHKIVNKYLAKLNKSLSSQVLIEARIYEIFLSEKFKTGINWSAIIGKNLNPTDSFQIQSQAEGIAFSLKGEETIPNVINALRIFGKVESIANPRILVSNNNTAILKSIENKVFFTLKQKFIALRQYLEKNEKESQPIDQITSEMQTVPVGMIIYVQPSIDPNGKITIALRPTISEEEKSEEDPAISIMTENKSKIKSTVPVIKTREIDTIFTVNPNEAVIIGGLISTVKKNTEQGLPFSRRPFGWLQGTRDKYSEKEKL